MQRYDDWFFIRACFGSRNKRVLCSSALLRGDAGRIILAKSLIIVKEESMSQSLVVFAEFEATEATVAKFLEVCQYDALHSKTDEPGCLEFVVHQSVDEPHLIALYEVYKDRAAFQAHEAAPHFAVFSNALKELEIKTRQIRFFYRQ